MLCDRCASSSPSGCLDSRARTTSGAPWSIRLHTVPPHRSHRQANHWPITGQSLAISSWLEAQQSGSKVAESPQTAQGALCCHSAALPNLTRHEPEEPEGPA